MKELACIETGRREGYIYMSEKERGRDAKKGLAQIKTHCDVQ